jgi:addiction module HigA family antidote
MGTPARRATRRRVDAKGTGGASPRLKPVHPGQVLQLDFLEPMGVSAYRLAKETGVSAQQIGRVIAGTRGVSADLALRLARFFGTSAEVWVNLQARYDLDAAEDESGAEIERRVRPFKAA